MRFLAPRISIKKTKSLFSVGILAFAMSAVGLFVSSPTVFARSMDCDNNAIMWCGFDTNSEFISKVSANDDGKGHRDLQAIYNHYGLSSSEYSAFQSKAKDGTMYRDGRVVVGDYTVMTGGKTLGRENFSGSSAVSISGRTYYKGTPDVRWVPGTNSMPVKVMFNASGVAEIVVLTSCGNPVDGPETPSAAECKQLNMTPVAGKPNTYRFTATAAATGNAKITKYVYNFGDGSPEVTKTSPTDPVEHTYTKAGDMTAKLTVYASAPGGTTIVSTADTCKKKVTVAKPYYECVKLDAVLANPNDKYTYAYTVTMKSGNGAKFESATFDYGDGGKQTVTTATGNTVKAQHTYKQPGDYVTQVSLKFDGKTVTSNGCKRPVTVVKPYYRCVRLDATMVDRATYMYRFVATMEYGNGAKFVSADFDFGDGKTTTGVKSSSATTVTTDHAYGSAKQYSAAATLRFTVNDKPVSAPTCRTLVPDTGEPGTPECKPGIPEGDVRCNPCPYDPTIPGDDTERCVAPVTELPNTGAGNVIALGAVALVGGFLVYRHMLFQKHKRAYLAADQGNSPLPLADPLQPDNQLAATPLAEQQAQRRRMSLRRRRQF